MTKNVPVVIKEVPANAPILAPVPHQPSEPPELTVTFLRLFPDVPVPSRKYEGVGYDLHAYRVSTLGRSRPFILAPHSVSQPIPTGLCIKPPPGIVPCICSRSGLAARGIFVANSPGIIDPDYTGELNVILYNGNHVSFTVNHLDRIAQLVFLPFLSPAWKEGSIPQTIRGSNGLGSTGI